MPSGAGRSLHMASTWVHNNTVSCNSKVPHLADPPRGGSAGMAHLARGRISGTQKSEHASKTHTGGPRSEACVVNRSIERVNQ